MTLRNKPSPPRTFTPDMAQQWYKLLGAIETEMGDAGLSNVLYVDQVDGNNDTAERGSIIFSYATIQAALDAAQAGDVVFVSPGTYTEDVVWPQTNNISLQGSGKHQTTVTNATAGQDAISIVPNGAPITMVSIADISVTATGLGSAIYANAATNNEPDSFDALYLLRVNTESASGLDISVTLGNMMYIRDVDAAGGVVFREVAEAIYEDLVAGYWTVRFAPDQITPTAGRLAHAATGVIIDNALTVESLAWVAVGADSAVGSISGELSDDDTFNVYGIIDFQGRVVGDTDVTFGFTEAALNPHVGVRMDSAELGGHLQVADSGDTGTERCVVQARHALLKDTTADVNQAGALVDMDIRGATFEQDSLSVADDGAIDRTHWVQEIAAGNSPATPVDWANSGGAVPYVTAPEFVGTESDTIGELPIAVVAKTTSSVTCEKTLDVQPHIVKAYLGGV